MRRLFLLVLFIMAFAGQAFAFTPDPTKYEFIGMKQDNGCGIFYEIASARAEGQKGVVVILQADPKNRTLRYYSNVIIDPDTMTARASSCELKDYKNNLLEKFTVPNYPISYTNGDILGTIYQDLLARGIVYTPKPVYAAPEADDVISDKADTSVSKSTQTQASYVQQIGGTKSPDIVIDDNVEESFDDSVEDSFKD